MITVNLQFFDSKYTVKITYNHTLFIKIKLILNLVYVSIVHYKRDACMKVWFKYLYLFLIIIIIDNKYKMFQKNQGSTLECTIRNTLL